MLWTYESRPHSLTTLSDALLTQALLRANRLLGRGHKEARAMCMAIAHAHEWADNDRREPEPILGAPVHVILEGSQWEVVAEDTPEPLDFHYHLDDAVERARGLAWAEQSSVFVYSPEGVLRQKHELTGANLDNSPLWVEPHRGGWGIRRPGDDEPFQRFSTKRQAVAHGRQLARKEHCELIIQYPGHRIVNR